MLKILGVAGSTIGDNLGNGEHYSKIKPTLFIRQVAVMFHWVRKLITSSL